MSTADIKLYQILKNDFNLSEDKAKEFTAAVSEMAKENTDISDFKSNIKEDLLRLELKLVSEIKDSKADMLKWFFGLFITLAIMIIGLYVRH